MDIMQLGKYLVLTLIFSYALVAAEETNNHDILKLDDYYEILGIERSVEKKAIKSAFRKLSKKYHPDVSKDPNAADIFTKLSEAYEVLFDDKKRKLYDRYGKEGLENERKGPGGGGGFEDQWGGFWDEGGQGRNQKPKPLVIEFFVDLELIATGGKIDFSHFGMFLCPHCHGSGADSPGDVETCSQCKGRGKVMTVRQIAPGYIQQMQSVCPKCRGKGKMFQSVCHVCTGDKYMPSVKTDFFWVDKGMTAGKTITLSGAAKNADEGEDTDAIIVLRHAGHPFFTKRDEINLNCPLSLTLQEALTGFEKEIKTLSQKWVDIGKTTITQPYEEITLRNHGLPIYNSGGDMGNLFVQIDIAMPSNQEVQANRKHWEEFFE